MTQLLIVWLITGFFAYGITFAFHRYNTDKLSAYMNTEEMEQSDRRLALSFGLAGPVGFIIALIMSGFAKRGLRY